MVVVPLKVGIRNDCLTSGAVVLIGKLQCLLPLARKGLYTEAVSYSTAITEKNGQTLK